MVGFRRPAPLLAGGAALAAIVLAAATAAAQGSDECGDMVAVERGDTLQRIADRCGIGLGALITANDEIANPDVLRVGMLLSLPGATGDDWEGIGSEVEARPGDTLVSIADRHSVPLAILMATNPALHPEELDPGTMVGLPGG